MKKDPNPVVHVHGSFKTYKRGLMNLEKAMTPARIASAEIARKRFGFKK